MCTYVYYIVYKLYAYDIIYLYINIYRHKCINILLYYIQYILYYIPRQYIWSYNVFANSMATMRCCSILWCAIGTHIDIYVPTYHIYMAVCVSVCRYTCTNHINYLPVATAANSDVPLHRANTIRIKSRIIYTYITLPVYNNNKGETPRTP